MKSAMIFFSTLIPTFITTKKTYTSSKDERKLKQVAMVPAGGATAAAPEGRDSHALTSLVGRW